MATNLVTGSLTPPNSISLNLKVSTGVAQVQRNVGNYSALYQAESANIQNVLVELGGLSVWSSNVQETFQRLVVSCSGPLILNAIKPDDTSIELPINRMFVLDSELKTFTLTNVNNEPVKMALNFVSVRVG